MALRILLFITLLFQAIPAEPLFPANPREMRQTVSFAELEKLLTAADATELMTVSVIGETTQGRKLYMVRANHADKPGDDVADKFKILFIGAQHGNEVAGKDALAWMINDLINDPDELPADVDLYLIPNINPDGTEADQRRNANNVDLNRVHQLLDQPEVRALHKVTRDLRPHIIVDCHEFGRDSEDYKELGLDEWPLIMMDCVSFPLVPQAVYELGLKWLEAPALLERMEDERINYIRYYVGGVPPEDEQRHSTLEPDDARNGLGAYGALSFIIESGVKRNVPDPNADLGERVLGYLILLGRFIEDAGLRAETREVVAAARREPLPAFLPVNAFWGNVGLRPTEVKVYDAATGELRQIATGNFMHERIVKKTVPTPAGYVIRAAAAPQFKTLLDAHGLAYEELPNATELRVEPCKLERVETEVDPVYNRFAGRQIVTRQAPATESFPAGSLVVRFDGGIDDRRKALLLEPAALYGLYQFAPWRALVTSDSGQLPVFRLINR